MNISGLRHSKEKFYLFICLLIGALVWAVLILGSVFSILLFLIPLGISLWIVGQFFKVSIYGNSVMVSENQYGKVHELVQKTSNEMGLENTPETFIVNSDGIINAIAIKFLSRKYILLFSNLVDVLWDEERPERLNYVIAHGLAHHAAGHTNFWINLLIKPALFVPYLGAAYSRSCILTADRIAASYVNNEEACADALVTMASGSRELVSQTNKNAFINQEEMIPGIFGFQQEILSMHPRMTRRMIAVSKFYKAEKQVL